jgi:hypothetical protein
VKEKKKKAGEESFIDEDCDEGEVVGKVNNYSDWGDSGK